MGRDGFHISKLSINAITIKYENKINIFGFLDINFPGLFKPASLVFVSVEWNGSSPLQISRYASKK